MGLLNLLAGGITWIILLLVLFLPFTFLLIFKSIVVLCARIFRPDLHTLSPNDSMVAPDSSTNRPLINFGFMIKCKGLIKVEAMRDRFSTCFLHPRSELDQNSPKYENFYSYVVTYGGYTFRKSVTDIDIETHVYEKQLGQNECIEDLAADWMLRNYVENAPNWEILLVPLPDETAVFFKIHHALADGYSLLYIIDKITGVKSPYLVKPFQDSILTEIRQTIEYPVHLGRLAGNPGGSPLKITRFDKPEWMYSFTSLNLNLVKSIRKKHNVHFASVLLTLLTGILRRYLLESKTQDELPAFLYNANTLPWPNHPVRSPNVTLCNHWVVGIVKLPLHMEDPLERLAAIEKDFSSFSDVLGIQKFIKRFMSPLMSLLPARLMRALFLSKDPGFSVGLTSMVGGNDYKMIARPISVIQPLLAIPDSNPFLPVSCFTFSHSDKLDVTLAVHPQHFPNHEALNRVTKDYLDQELEKLRVLSAENITQEN